LVPYALASSALPVLAAQGRFAAAALSALLGAVVLSALAFPMARALGGLGILLSAACGMLAWAIAAAMSTCDRERTEQWKIVWGPLAAATLAVGTTIGLSAITTNTVATAGGIASLALAYRLFRVAGWTDLAVLARLPLRR
jgi:O-antigen/teichoic acid export membrane protein